MTGNPSPASRLARRRAHRTRNRRATLLTLALLLLVLGAAFIFLEDPALLGSDPGPVLPVAPPQPLWQFPLSAAAPPWALTDDPDVEWHGAMDDRYTLVAARRGERVWAAWFDTAGHEAAAWEADDVTAFQPVGSALVVARPGDKGLGLYLVTPQNRPQGTLLMDLPAPAGFITALPLDHGLAVVAGGPGADAGEEAAFWHEWTYMWPALPREAIGAGGSGGAGQDAAPFSRLVLDSPVLAQAPGLAPLPRDGPSPVRPAPALAQVSLPLPEMPAWELTVLQLPVAAGDADAPSPGVKVLWHYEGDASPWRPWWVARGARVWATRGRQVGMLGSQGVLWSADLAAPVEFLAPLDFWGRRALVALADGDWAIYHNSGVEMAASAEDFGESLWPWPGAGFFGQGQNRLTAYDAGGRPQWSITAGRLRALAAHPAGLLLIDEDFIRRYRWP